MALGLKYITKIDGISYRDHSRLHTPNHHLRVMHQQKQVNLQASLLHGVVIDVHISPLHNMQVLLGLHLNLCLEDQTEI